MPDYNSPNLSVILLGGAAATVGLTAGIVLGRHTLFTGTKDRNVVSPSQADHTAIEKDTATTPLPILSRMNSNGDLKTQRTLSLRSQESIGYRTLEQNTSETANINYKSPSLHALQSNHTNLPPPMQLNMKSAEVISDTYALAHEKQLQHFEGGLTSPSAALQFDQPPAVLRFVLTGGPCAGKTTALARLSSFLRHRGYRVYTVPEAATMLFTNGASFRDLDTDERQIAFQAALMNTQIHLEDTFARIAMAHARNEADNEQNGSNKRRPAVLLCDRGTMDGSAYLDPALWKRLLKEYGIQNEVSIRDQRYNAVFHLVTAANGAESFYTLDNNATRLESPQEACHLDAGLQTAWNGHPRLLVFDNSTGFEGKLERVVDSMSRLLGLPSSRRCFRKYRLKTSEATAEYTPDNGDFPSMKCYFNPDALPVPHQSFDVEKVYVTVCSDVELPQRAPTTEGTNTLSSEALREQGINRSREHVNQVIGAWASNEKQTPVKQNETSHTTPVRTQTNKDTATLGTSRMSTQSHYQSPATATTDFGQDIYKDVGNIIRFPYGFVRRRTQNGVSSHGHTLVTLAEGTANADVQTIETKRIISSSAYRRACHFQRDPLHNVVRQRRTSFLWQNQYFEVTEYLSPRPEGGLVLLAVQEPAAGSKTANTGIALPPFLEVEAEVTGDEHYSAYYLSLTKEERVQRESNTLTA